MEGMKEIVDKECIVIGGGVGMEDGFIDMLREEIGRN